MSLDSSFSGRKAVHYINEPTRTESPQSTDYQMRYAGTGTPIVIDNGKRQACVWKSLVLLLRYCCRCELAQRWMGRREGPSCRLRKRGQSISRQASWKAGHAGWLGSIAGPQLEDQLKDTV